MSSLADRACVPCRGGVPPLGTEEASRLLRELPAGWRLVDAHHIEKEFRFPDFRAALEFSNRVGALAEEVNHHPDLHVAWGRVKVLVWTHKIDGLTESDFVFAAKSDRLVQA